MYEYTHPMDEALLHKLMAVDLTQQGAVCYRSFLEVPEIADFCGETSLQTLIVHNQDGSVHMYIPHYLANEYWDLYHTSGVARLYNAIQIAYGDVHILNTVHKISVQKQIDTLNGVALTKPHKVGGAFMRLEFSAYYPQEEHPILKKVQTTKPLI